MKVFIVSVIKFFISCFRCVRSQFFKLRLNMLKRDFKEFGSGSSFAPNVYFKGKECISIGSNTKIDSFSEITAWKKYQDASFSPQIVIGDNCYIGKYNHITSINRINISDNTIIGKWVTITDNSHGQFLKEQLQIHPLMRPLYSKGEVIIGKNVWICDKATITAGVTIGDGCIIAANAVVTKSVPPNSLVAGSPAKVIKTINMDDNE